MGPSVRQVDAAQSHRRARPSTSGSLEVDGFASTNCSRVRSRSRRPRRFIFQCTTCCRCFSAERNVELPLLLTNLDRESRMKRVRAALKLAASKIAPARPRELSAGQEQRVGIARPSSPTDAAAVRRTHRRPRPQVGRRNPDPARGAQDDTARPSSCQADPHAAESAPVIHLDKGTLSEVRDDR